MAEKILVRAGMAPYETMTPAQFMKIKPYGTNIGNLVYAYGVFRALMTDAQTEVIADGYRAEYGYLTQGEIDEINQTCSAFVIPLADAFRPSFLGKLRNLTAVINKLTIPVVVAGAGIKAPLGYELSSMEPCNEAVRSFVHAVLEHSALLGLRGEHTARYLRHLGYVPERDFTPIGCPSMFCRGGVLPPGAGRRPGRLSSASRLVVTNNIYASGTLHRFIRRVMETYPDHTYIPQLHQELESAWYGEAMPELFKRSAAFPSDYKAPPYAGGGRVRIPFNLPSWWEAVEGHDLAVGPRLHGSIMCMLAGVPTLVLPRDIRTLEVCEYHSFACVPQNELGEETRLEGLLPGADFGRVRKRQRENFEHYVSFLEQNGLKHTLNNEDIAEKAPLDAKMAQVRLLPAQRPCCQAGAGERLARKTRRGADKALGQARIYKKKLRSRLRKIISG